MKKEYPYHNNSPKSAVSLQKIEDIPHTKTFKTIVEDYTKITRFIANN